MIKRALTICALTSAAVMVGVGVRDTVLSYREPYIFYGVGAITPKVRVGEPFQYWNDYDRLRHCETWLVTFIFNRDTNQVEYRSRVPGGAATGIGRHYVTLHIATKNMDGENLKPGRYSVHSHTDCNCTSGTYEMPWPDVDFEITDK